MVQGIQNITGVSSAAAGGNVAPPKTTAAPAAPAPATPAKPAIEALSPRVRQDVLAGVNVVEFVGNGGDVTMQFPSAAALAYLRAGLTSSGLNEDQPAPPVQEA